MAKFGRKKSGTGNKHVDKTDHPARDASDNKHDEAQGREQKTPMHEQVSDVDSPAEAPDETDIARPDTPSVGDDEVGGAGDNREDSQVRQEITGEDSSDDGTDDAAQNAASATGHSTAHGGDPDMALESLDPTAEKESEASQEDEIENVRR